MMNNRFKLGFYSHLNIDHQHIYKAHISMVNGSSNLIGFNMSSKYK